jgi:putative FmdB family regulatory protein
VPLYEYECQACKHRFERIQQFKDPLVKKCPKCGRSKVRKLLSAPAVQFKGTGWYITDYQRKGSSTTLPDGGSQDKSEKKDAGKEPAAREAPGKDSGKKGKKKE